MTNAQDSEFKAFQRYLTDAKFYNKVNVTFSSLDEDLQTPEMKQHVALICHLYDTHFTEPEPFTDLDQKYRVKQDSKYTDYVGMPRSTSSMIVEGTTVTLKSPGVNDRGNLVVQIPGLGNGFFILPKYLEVVQ